MTSRYFARTATLLISLMVLGCGTFASAQTEFQQDLEQVAMHLIKQRPIFQKTLMYVQDSEVKRNRVVEEGELVPILKEDKKFRELYDECKKESKVIAAMLAIMAEKNPEAFRQYVTQEAAAIRNKKEGNQILTALIDNGVDTIIEEQKRSKELDWEVFLLFLGAGSQGATAAPQETTPKPAPAPVQASAPAAPPAAAVSAQPATPPPAPAGAGGGKFTKYLRPMDPRRAKQVADSFTSAVEQRKYYASAETAPGSGIVGITYGSKEKLPETTPAAASAVPSGGGEDAITKDLASGLTDSNGSLDPQLLRKAAGQICAQHGFKNHDLVTQIRASSEKVIEELHPREPEQ